jgi:hypothetical protein
LFSAVNGLPRKFGAWRLCVDQEDERAIADFETALSLDPNNVEYQNMLAFAKK